jgi:AcrR family transcriptional regulator
VKGDAASMDDVAARAGTTKPTVYAHFKSKDELFSAVVELVKGLFLGKLRSPDVCAAEPVEAVALFCVRFLELVSWRDFVGYQRVAPTAAARSRNGQGGLRHPVCPGVPVPGRLPTRS